MVVDWRRLDPITGLVCRYRYSIVLVEYELQYILLEL